MQKETLEPIVLSYKSKVLWAAIIQVAAVFASDDVKNWYSQNPEWGIAGQAIVSVILRNFTSGKIKWKFWEKPSLP